MPKLLIVVGLILVGIGLLWQAGVPFGRLPGDITIRRGNTTIFIPIATSILVSLLLTVIASFFKR